jgi:hypothetical protein
MERIGNAGAGFRSLTESLTRIGLRTTVSD